MADHGQLSWPSIQQLLPLVLNLSDQLRRGEEISLREVADRIGLVFGVTDVDAFAASWFRDAVASGMTMAGDGFQSGANEAIADIFAACCEPIMTAIVAFAQGELNGNDVLRIVGDINLSCVNEVQEAMRVGLGVPDELAELVSRNLGPLTVSVYAFAAAYQIYRSAARDAELARERRIEVERLCQETIAELKAQRAELEATISAYLLDRLLPFEKGIHAMDQAILDSDDDGFIRANAELWELFGHEAQYHTADEFDELMLSDDSFRL